MSHQSGITGTERHTERERERDKKNNWSRLLFRSASEKLREKFAEMKDGHIRVVAVIIENGKNVIAFFDGWFRFCFLLFRIVGFNKSKKCGTFVQRWSTFSAKEKESFWRIFFRSDFDKMIAPMVQADRPAYYFVRLDTISELSGHNWLLIVYIPDDAKVKQRF